MNCFQAYCQQVMRVVPRCVALLLGALALLPLSTGGAQTVRGGVRDESGAPIAGAVVMLLDARDGIRARALTDDRGDFILSAGGAGMFRLRMLRIGFRPWMSSPLALNAGETTRHEFTVQSNRFVLDTLRVSSRAQCAPVRASAASEPSAAESVWEQVQAALTAAQLSVSQRPFAATTLYFERELERTGQHVLSQRSVVDQGNVSQPWQSVSPEQLHRRGYVAVDFDSTTFYAPGLEALLSPWFLVDHCLHVASTTDSAQTGIRFEPIPSRSRLAEVRGTLWLDRATSRLTRLTFEYANVSRAQQEHAGGEMEFVPLGNGRWTISRWVLRMPNLELALGGPRAARIDPRILVRSIRHVGGELLSATASRGDRVDTLWSRTPLALRGTVLEAESQRPVPNARIALVGTEYRATSDSAGLFTLGDVLPGEYSIEVRTDALERSNRVYKSMVVMSDRATSVVIRMPPVRTVARDNSASTHTADAAKPRAQEFVGSVLDISKRPIEGAELSLPELSLTVTSRADGSFWFRAVPPGRHRFAVRMLGYGPLDAVVETTDRATTLRTVFLSRVTTLDSVRVEANVTLPSFEENRRVGLGRFLTRDDLAKLEDRTLAAVFNDMGGVSLMRGANNRVWIGSSRRQLGSTVLDKSDQLEGAKAGCYAHVYLDNMRVYAGKHREPLFDINSLSPDRIEAIEYYASPASTPAKYSGLGATCGVVVIWSRRSP